MTFSRTAPRQFVTHYRRAVEPLSERMCSVTSEALWKLTFSETGTRSGLFNSKDWIISHHALSDRWIHPDFFYLTELLYQSVFLKTKKFTYRKITMETLKNNHIKKFYLTYDKFMKYHHSILVKVVFAPYDWIICQVKISLKIISECSQPLK